MNPDCFLYEQNRARERRAQVIFELFIGAAFGVGALIYWLVG